MRGSSLSDSLRARPAGVLPHGSELEDQLLLGLQALNGKYMAAGLGLRSRLSGNQSSASWAANWQTVDPEFCGLDVCVSQVLRRYPSIAYLPIY